MPLSTPGDAPSTGEETRSASASAVAAAAICTTRSPFASKTGAGEVRSIPVPESVPSLTSVASVTLALVVQVTFPRPEMVTFDTQSARKGTLLHRSMVILLSAHGYGELCRIDENVAKYGSIIITEPSRHDDGFSRPDILTCTLVASFPYLGLFLAVNEYTR
jgi:hypothetical protein